MVHFGSKKRNKIKFVWGFLPALWERFYGRRLQIHLGIDPGREVLRANVCIS